MDAEAEHHVHESPLSMTGVLVVLAVLSAVGGFLAIPHFLEPLLPLPDVVPALRALRDAARRRLDRASRSPGSPARRTCSAATARAPSGCARRFAGAAPRALRQVLRRRGLRRAASGGRCTGSRTASSCGSATACCSTARCTASPRSRGAPPAAVARADRQPAALRAARARRASSPALAWSWRHG